MLAPLRNLQNAPARVSSLIKKLIAEARFDDDVIEDKDNLFGAAWTVEEN